VTLEVAAAPTHGAQRARMLPLTKRIRHGWIIEVVAAAGVFLVYDQFRDHLVGATTTAFDHARQVVAIEQFVGLYHGRAIQQAFLSVDWLVAFWNIFYGTIHFVLPVVVLVVLYVKAPERYRRWRNVLVFVLGLGLVGFWLYPLMPPRLMPARYGFVDTAAKYFNFGPQVRVVLGPDGQPGAAAIRAYGNLYAAMPSLHVAWSTWCVLALWPLLRRRAARVLLVLYPVAMLLCIVVTGNHWILDAVGAWVVLALAYACALGVERLSRRARPAGEDSRPRTSAQRASTPDSPVRIR
jgi:membrane-associated phospholipid phosphatase